MACVQDNNTGLMWARAAIGSASADNRGKTSVSWKLLWVQVKQFWDLVDQANVSNLAGDSDWRIPNK